MSENKFGPSRVVCRTPPSNIRITTFFADEHEVRVIDPARVVLLAAIGCEVRLTAERVGPAVVEHVKRENG